MYSINFTCPKAQTNRAGQNRIKLWVNVNGERSAVSLELRADPDEFKKSLYSKRSNHISRYCSTIRLKVEEFYAECVSKGIKVQSSTLADFVSKYFYNLSTHFAQWSVSSTTCRSYSCISV